MRITRLLDRPIIGPELHESLGPNIQGPSLIRVPDWVPNPLGRYYLYFADHKGSWIRLAYADALTGPWRIHAPGALPLGVQIVAAPWREDLALRVAFELERMGVARAPVAG